MASGTVHSLSLPDTEVLSSSIASRPSIPQKNSFAYPPIALVTLAAHPSAVPLTNLFGSLITKPPQSGMPVGQAMQASKAVVHLAAGLEPEAPGAYYVDSPSDEEAGVAVEAQVDSLMGDLEQLFQEQLVSQAEDLAEYQVERKGKAVVTDPLQEDHASIRVLEEDSAAADSPRPDELITRRP